MHVRVEDRKTIASLTPELLDKVPEPKRLWIDFAECGSWKTSLIGTMRKVTGTARGPKD